MSEKITVADYNEKSILVSGETKPYKEDLKKVGGRWNDRLFGWIFPTNRRSAVEAIVQKPPSAAADDEEEKGAKKKSKKAEEDDDDAPLTAGKKKAGSKRKKGDDDDDDAPIKGKKAPPKKKAKGDAITIDDYSEKAIAVRGDTTGFKAKFKKAGGSYKEALKDGAEGGWIFPKGKKAAVEAIIKGGPDEDDEAEELKEGKGQPITIDDYSEKAIAVRGDTSALKEKFKKAGGTWNDKLKGGAGWIFPKGRRAAVEGMIKAAGGDE